MNTTKKVLSRKKSPYILAAIIGVVDLTAGLMGMFADLIWIIRDEILYTHNFATNSSSDMAIIGLLIFAVVFLLTGLALTIYAVVRYFKTGMCNVEQFNEHKYYAQIRQTKIRKKALEKMESISKGQ